MNDDKKAFILALNELMGKYNVSLYTYDIRDCNGNVIGGRHELTAPKWNIEVDELKDHMERIIK